MKQVKFSLPLKMLTLICVLFISASAFAQQIAVKGHVKDEAGEPIIGATVRIVGHTSGTVTDIDGNFTLNAASGAKVSVSSVSYTHLTLPTILRSCRSRWSPYH